MPRLAANLSLLFNELVFIDRFAAAADAGFRGVEYLFPYSERADAIAAQIERHGLEQVLFNFPPGDWDAGDRGIAGAPDRIQEFRAGVPKALEYARATGCRRLHAMAGLVADAAATDRHRDTFVDNLRYVADQAGPLGIEILVEPINSRIDMPGYLIDTTGKALAVLDAVARPNVRLQYDIYHAQIMEGDLARTIETHLSRIGHVQLADNPGRHEPGTGEIAYDWLLARLDELGYDGWVGCEYRPVAGTVEGLGWAADYL